jgi:methionine sulfoxide reductase heme-binding subunit
MRGSDPGHYLWWLVSRASGIVALALISASVLLGLAMAARLIAPRRKRTAVRLHESLAMISLAAVGLHGAALLGDTWLKPGLAGITVPFAIGYRPAFVACGIAGGYLALLLGPSFYLRRRIGGRTWRRLHRLIVVAWLLSVVHTLGAGSDASAPWLRAVVMVPAVPIAYALVARVLGGSPRPQRKAAGPRGPECRDRPDRPERPERRQPAVSRAGAG